MSEKFILPEQSEWDFDLLTKIDKEIARVAKNFGLDTYPNQLEVITSEQMMNAYSSIGMPTSYNHWSFGKSFLGTERSYKRGEQGLAYEIVINSNPCIAYLMEENSLTMQALVIAHACVSGDTEYLSPEGWKRIDQYDGGLVAQYSKDGSAEFIKPSNYIKRPQDKFIYVKGSKVEQKITEDHRVVFINGNNNLVEITGLQLKTKQEEKTRGFNGKFISAFNLKKNSTGLPLSDNELRLHIAIKADGNIIQNKHNDHFNCVDHDKIRFHLKKSRKIERLETLLNNMGIEFNKSPTYGGRYNINFKYHVIEKRYTKEWYSANEHQLNIIADEILYWDGCFAYNSFSSEYKEDIDFIQYVWSSTGTDTYVGYGTRAWNIHRLNRKLTGIGSNRGKDKFEYIPSEDGLAYCFTVDSGMFITRMNNKISVTGNCYGHNSFFKNNYLFKTNTDAEAIIDYMVFAKNYIAECEEKYGYEKVELLLDSCHALQNFGVDRYKRPSKISLHDEKLKQKERAEYAQSQVNELWKTIPQKNDAQKNKDDKRFPEEPEENILYFIEKNAPLLETWEREIIRIIRKIAQYFYPQRSSQVMNEGWATFWHYTILNQLYEEGIVGDGFMMEFLQSHTSVTAQYPMQPINPYALGFAMFMDIKRISENPTDEDRAWFPDLIDKDWKTNSLFAMENFKDESFILQYLSPKVIRDFHFFSILDDDEEFFLEVNAIHDDAGYRKIRQALSDQYNLSKREPNIQVYDVDLKGDRTLSLRHTQMQNRGLNEYTNEMLRHLVRLWGFDVSLTTVDENGNEDELIYFAGYDK